MVGHRLARVQLDDLDLSAVVGLLVVGDPFLSADSVSSVLPASAILIVGTGKNDYRSTPYSIFLSQKPPSLLKKSSPSSSAKRDAWHPSHRGS